MIYLEIRIQLGIFPFLLFLEINTNLILSDLRVMIDFAPKMRFAH